MKYTFMFFAMAAAIIFCSCRPVRDAHRANPQRAAKESSIIFTRAAHFTPFFGSYSMSQFFEIIYERASRNEAGQLVVEIGIRNRGPVNWTNWHMHAPERISLNTHCNFYRGDRVVSPIVYSTNHQRIVIGRGETYAYKAVCPVLSAESYQLVLGD